MLLYFLHAVSTIISAEIPYNKECGTPKCLEYFDGCNDCQCNINDDTVSCTEMACKVNETPYCRKCEEGSFWLRFDTFQSPGYPTCAAREYDTPIIAQNNSKCACPRDYPYYEPRIGCINERGCIVDIIHQKDMFKLKKPHKGRCHYDYQLCTSNDECEDGLICNIPDDNYETCIPLTARLDKKCELQDCNRCLFDQCVGTGYGYCSISTDCETGGCSGQICGPNAGSIITTCEFKCEYQCLRYQKCGRMDRMGTCGWYPPDNESKVLYTQCMEQCKEGNQPIVTLPEPTGTIPNDEECAKNGQCYNPINEACGDLVSCPNGNSCNDILPPICKAYPNAKCQFTACNGCYVYFTDFVGNVIGDCDVDICTLPGETGPCRAAKARYFYNSEAGECQSFVYGGCDGNGNNFETLEDCQKACGPKIIPECVPGGYIFVGDPGLCARILFFCEEGYVYWGDGQCGCGCKPDICSLPKVVGPCKAAFTHYFYNSTTGDCEEFTYGGCEGNENNFKSLADCQHECDGDIPVCVPEGYSFLGDVETCKLIRYSCPFDWEAWNDESCGCGCKPT